MVNLQTEYLGLKLKNPFIIGSSGLTAKIENIVAYERAGASAIILKSLFEEQMDNEAAFLNEQSALYPENMDYLYSYTKQYSLTNYMELIKEAKAKVSIPIIASVNCYTNGSWLSTAKLMQEAGADALEVNLYTLALDKEKSANEIEEEYLKIVGELTKGLAIPVSVKIGQNFTSLPAFVEKLKGYGAKGAVMFNRFYRPDIDLKTLKITSATPFSDENECLIELRWIAIVSSLVRQFDLCASTGIHKPEDAIKMILSGAKGVQLCSTVYKNGADVISKMVEELEKFMQEKGFETIADFNGKLNYSNIESPQKYERVQFMKTFGAE